MPLADGASGTPPSTTGARKGGTGRPGSDAPSASRPDTALQNYTQVDPVRLPALPDEVTADRPGLTYMPGPMGTMVLTPVTVPETTEGQVAGEEKEQQEEKSKGRKSYEMTWDEYNALSDQQRAAVDFNTMLVQARQKDLRLQDKYEQSGSQRSTYNAAVERMFGDSGGSQMYAPETVAVLNQIGYTSTDAKKGDDLDDFLGLKAAITEKDIGNLELPSKLPVEKQVTEGFEDAVDSLPFVNVSGDTAAELNDQLIARTQELQDKLTQGNTLLMNFRKTAASARNEELSYLGGKLNKTTLPEIQLPEGVDRTYFQQAYQALSNSAVDPAVLDAIRTDLEPKGQMKDFMRYADTLSKYAAQYETGLGGDPAVQYRSPQEFRAILGLSKKEGE